MRATGRLVLCSLLTAAVLTQPGVLGAATQPWANVFPGNVVAVATLPPAAAGSPQVIVASRTSDPAGIYRSTDGGTNWEPVHDTVANSLSADAGTAGRFYAATAAGLFRFDNWGDAAPVLLNANVIYSIAVNPANPSVLFGDNLRSIDGGTNWAAMTGLPAFTYTFGDNFPHVAVADNAIFLVATCGTRNAYRSANGGASWVPVNDMIDTVAIDPSQAGYFYTGSCTTTNLRCGPTDVCTSLNLTPHVHAIVANAFDPDRVFAVSTATGIMFSPDRGAHWLGNAPLAASVREGAIRFDDVSKTIYLPTSVGLLVKNDSCVDLDLDGFSPEGGCGPEDCNDGDATLSPARTELCSDYLDNDCNGYADYSDSVCIANCSDTDGDGFFPKTPSYCGGDDCNNADAGVNPGAVEVVSDGIDQDCNGYDLTIAVTKAAYTGRKDSLAVEARSALGQSAALAVAGFGPLVWNAKRGYWAATFAPVGGKPAQITVQGVEGSVTSAVSGK